MRITPERYGCHDKPEACICPLYPHLDMWLEFVRRLRAKMPLFCNLFSEYPVCLSVLHTRRLQQVPARTSCLFLPMIVIFVLFYFMLVRPQQKRPRTAEHDRRSAKGDEVVTTGGALGKVVKLSEQYVTLELSANVQVTFQRTAIQAVLPKGTLKDI